VQRLVAARQVVQAGSFGTVAALAGGTGVGVGAAINPGTTIMRATFPAPFWFRL
jgi:hypothetical protein